MNDTYDYVIEKCKACGGRVQHYTLPINPPIKGMECTKCGLKKELRAKQVVKFVDLEADDQRGVK